MRKVIEKDTLIWRNKEIAQHYYNDGMTMSEIAKLMDLSYQMVWRVMRKMKKLGDKKTITEYFEIGTVLDDMFDSIGENPDDYVGRILNGMWIHEILSRSKFKKLTDEEFDEFLHCKQMRCAGDTVWDVMKRYRMSLKKPLKKLAI